MKAKKCTKCNKVLPIKDFWKDKKSKDGHCWECKYCYKKRVDQWKKAHPGQYRKKNIKSARRSFLKYTYNITLSQYDKMYESQKGVCAICKGINLDGRRLAVDHNHKTGKVRGLLCLKCNAAVGGIEHLGNLLGEAVKYLKRYE